MADAFKHTHIFGLKGDVKGCVHYVDENVIVYPAGHNVVWFNSERNEQRFIPASEGSRGITSITLSHQTTKARYMAIAEWCSQATVSIFNTDTLKRRRVIANPDIGSEIIVSMCFSNDNKMLLIQGGAPDWTLYCYMWEKGKLIAQLKPSGPSKPQIHQVSFHPQDSSIVCLSGNGVFKFYRITDGIFKPLPSPLQKREPKNYPCHVWLSGDRLVTGTEGGEILYFENFEFKSGVSPLPSDEIADSDLTVDCLCAFGKGIIVTLSDGRMAIMEFSDDIREIFKKTTKVFNVDDNKSRVTGITICPSGHNFVCSTATNALYTLGLTNIDILKPEELICEHLHTSFHGPGLAGLASVSGLDTCIRKPLIATCGMDRTIRIWNYRNYTIEIMKHFDEEPYSIAFHPSGLQILVGFATHLYLMDVLIDDIRQLKEFPIKACREVKFSNGGHLFAACTGNSVCIYRTYTGEMISSVRIHSSKVRSIQWSPDDQSVYSTGVDGAIYHCLVLGGHMKNEKVFKGSSFACVEAKKPESVFVAGDTVARPNLYQLNLVGGDVIADVDIGTAQIGCLLLSPDQKRLFAGVSTPSMPGAIRCYPLPFVQLDASDDAEEGKGSMMYNEIACHSAPVTRMCFSADNSLLFTCSEDGSLCIIEVSNFVSSKDFDLSKEMLVRRGDVEAKTQFMTELQAKVAELTRSNEFQLRVKDQQFQQRIEDLTEKFTQELKLDKMRCDKMEDDKKNMESTYSKQLREQEELHQNKLHTLEETYQNKVNNEEQRYVTLSDSKEELQKKWDKQNALFVESHDKFVRKLETDYQEKIQMEREWCIQFVKEKQELVTEFQELQKKIEDGADKEIDELKLQMEAKLNAEKEATLRLKGENGIMKKKFNTLGADIDDQKEQIRALVEKEKDRYALIRALEKDIQGHKKEIKERDETVIDKEKRIFDLKKKNQELEKFKFVLDYKIKELKRQIEPREQEIQDMEQQIKDMDVELAEYHKSNAALDLMIGELRLKAAGLQKHLQGHKDNLRDKKEYISLFRKELHHAIQHVDDYKAAKSSVVLLYKRFVQNMSVGPSESDPQQDFSRQREHLEKTVESLKRKIAKDIVHFRETQTRLQRENVTLTKEINSLRRELSFYAPGAMFDEDGTLRLSRQQQRMSQSQLPSRPQTFMTHSNHSSTMTNDDANAEIEMQEQQIEDLRQQLEDLARMTPRPGSSHMALDPM